MLAIAFCLSSAGVMYSHRISPRADQGIKRPEEQSQKGKSWKSQSISTRVNPVLRVHDEPKVIKQPHTAPEPIVL